MNLQEIATAQDLARIESKLEKVEGLLSELLSKQDPREGWYTVQEYAERLGVSPSTVHRWVTDGRLIATYNFGPRMVRGKESK